MALIWVGNIHTDHNFIVVHPLITPVILGMDFLQKHGIVLDFTTIPVTIQNKRPPTSACSKLQPTLEAARKTKNTICAIAPSQNRMKILLMTVQFHCLMLPLCMTYLIPKTLISGLSWISTKNYSATYQGRVQLQSTTFQPRAIL